MFVVLIKKCCNHRQRQGTNRQGKNFQKPEIAIIHSELTSHKLLEFCRYPEDKFAQEINTEKTSKRKYTNAFGL